jgi:DNA-binding NtrC family response regulator
LPGRAARHIEQRQCTQNWVGSAPRDLAILGAVRRTTRTTQEAPASAIAGLRSRAPVPGLVLVFSVDRPRCDALPLEDGALEIGRDAIGGVEVDDSQMSRRHARVICGLGAWEVEDLRSRNGTFVDRERLIGRRGGAPASAGPNAAPRVVRAGSSIFLIKDDVEPFRAGISNVAGVLLGPLLVQVWDAIGRAARSGTTLHVHGESGTGKEHAAQAFHALGPRREGPFVAVNCAAIAKTLAESQLFGVKKGGHSMAAADAEGHLQAAHRGVLFLDEVGELDLELQAKLLRALEVKEVTPVGASRPVKVDFALVSATHRDLRAQVEAGKLREDLFFRIARPEVRLPPLRERLEEIPWLVDTALRGVSAGDGAGEGAPLKANASLIEACLTRAWPGNVRELLAEIRAAAQEARSAGSAWVQAVHLSASAGQAFTPAPAASAPAPAAAEPEAPADAPRRASLPDDDALIEEALRKANGNVTRAAQALGVHRTQLRRWRARRGTGGEQGEAT